MVNALREPSKHSRICYSRGDLAFLSISSFIIFILMIAVLYPLIYVVSASFSEGKMVSAGKVVFLPVSPSIEGYEAVFRYDDVWRCYLNTICYTLLGTFLNVLLCMLCAYPLSRRDLPGRNIIMLGMTFTMYFGGGMIPTYILIRDLGIIDTIWAMVLPGAVTVYHVILIRTFLQSSIPEELHEATEIDGCDEWGFFIRIVLPLSKAIIAVIGLYAAVAYWNGYFDAMLYLNTWEKMPLQIILREILVSNQLDSSMIMDPELHEARAELADVLKYSLIVVATVPILFVYPFIQKYFVQGIMIGSIKG